jgi:dinuclear metal center YbgI/SA1388 family protein
MAKIEQILQFMEEVFEYATFPDYPHALNGLQVSGPEEVNDVSVGVDASEVTLREAGERGSHLLIVHHGLFWDGLGPLTGARYRKVSVLVKRRLGLFSLHLPLDAHVELGNAALLARAIGVSPDHPFGHYQDRSIGWWGEVSFDRAEVVGLVGAAAGGEVRLVPGGPARVSRVGVVTGGGYGFLEEAYRLGLDTLVTGEAPHHAFHAAMEMGINLILGGHYATETFGVKALGARLAQEFGVSWQFLDYPTGF